MARVGIDNFYVCEDISSNSHNAAHVSQKYAGPTQLENNPTEPQVDLHSIPIEDELFMVNNNLLNIPKGDNTMKNLTFNIEVFQQQIEVLNNLNSKELELIEQSKDVKARLAFTRNSIKNCEAQIAKKSSELANKIEDKTNSVVSLELELSVDEKALEVENLKLANLEGILRQLDINEFSVGNTPSHNESSSPNDERSSTIPMEEQEERSIEEIKADLALVSVEVNKATQHTKDVFALDKTKKDIDETLATPEGKAQIIDGLNSLVNNNNNNLLTYEELVKGNIFSKRTEDGFMPDILVSTILNRLTKAIAVDKANALRVCKDFKNHHNPVLTKAQKKLFMTFIRSNKVS